MAVIIENKTRVPAFAGIEDVRVAQGLKREQGEADLYPRDGSKRLFDLERQVADLLGVRRGNLLLYNTGMSAVVDALEAARPTSGTTILRGEQQYSQAGNYISDDLKERGVEVYQTDAGSLRGIERDLEFRRPNIVFFETVTNGSSMAVLDTEGFLSLPVLGEVDPLIIIDNTLPTSTANSLWESVERSARKIIVVESGTKFIGVNSEMCGLNYTADNELLSKLRKRRQRTGSLLSASAVETIRGVKPLSPDDFHRRNRSIFRNTLNLGRVCAETLGEEGKFEVVHPNLPSHPNYEYANAKSPEGISPVFFLIPRDLGLSDNYYRLAGKLKAHPVTDSLADLGQSFGFDRVRIWPDDNSPVLRISGGVYSSQQETALAQAFSEVLSRF